MERLYNPDLMPEAEIKATFVAREPLLNDLVNLVANQSQGAGVQHVILVAPRGMGKTTLLLMVQFAIADRGLDAQWQSVRFPEESYAITDLADFWLETLRHLSVAIEQPAIDEQADALLAQYRNPKDLEEAALAQLKQWSRENGKRILLLVDNFDQILEQIRDERDEAALRNVLMNDGTFMLIGAAPAHFHEITNYGNALYNFFKIYNLEDLKFEEILELLRQRAAADNVPDYEEVLRANATKLKVLRYFTGGNPRLILMLYRVVSQSQIGEVREALEKLLDEVTPFYKAKIDSLPPQQRKILDHIARVSAQTNEGLTPSEIADATRISAQSASTQLKRLSDLGYVRAANLRGRNSYYALSEPLYAIWHQMRFGRGPQKRVGWLVNFLKHWYSDEEKPLESARLSGLFKDFMQKSEKDRAQSALSHLHYLSLAMENHPARAQAVDKVVAGHLQLEEYDLLKQDILPQLNLDDVSSVTLVHLIANNCLKESEWVKQILRRPDLSAKVEQLNSTFATLEDANNALKEDRFQDTVSICDEVLLHIEIPYVKSVALELKGIALFFQGEVNESSDALITATDLTEGLTQSLHILAACSLSRNDYANSLVYINKAIDSAKDDSREPCEISELLGMKMICLAINKQMEDVFRVLQELTLQIEDFDDWGFNAMQSLQMLSAQGHARRVREVIAETETEEIFFPLARALDYLFSGDEALIEKLSPEMRPLVSEIVDKLRPSVEGAAQPATAKRKPKTPSRNRTRKRLK